MWVALVQLILGAGLGGLGIALGISDLITGHASGKYGEYARSDSPVNYWINTGFDFLIGIAVIVVLARVFFAKRTSSDDDQ